MSDQPARPHGSDSRVADGWTVGFTWVAPAAWGVLPGRTRAPVAGVALAILGTVAYLLFTPGGHDPQDATG
jgi:hypothetical protein